MNCADISDQATEQEERARALAIQAAQAAPAVDRTGRCHWCTSQVAADRVYCDFDCLDDHRKALQAAKRNGLGKP